MVSITVCMQVSYYTYYRENYSKYCIASDTAYNFRKLSEIYLWFEVTVCNEASMEAILGVIEELVHFRTEYTAHENYTTEMAYINVSHNCES